MKAFVKFGFIFLLLALAGCQQPNDADSRDLPRDVNKPEQAYDSSLAEFSAQKVTIMPLSEVKISADGREGQVRAFVSLHDSFNCQQKWPAVFRFEIYNRVFRSAQPRGKRIYIWPDIDLTDAKENNSYWRDFLRAYEFNLKFEYDGGKDYVLQVTCLIDERKRISAGAALQVKETSKPAAQ